MDEKQRDASHCFFPLLRTNQMMVLDPGRQTHVVFSARDLRANTKHAGRTCCAGLTRTRHDTRGLRAWRVLLLQGQAGKVGIVRTRRKGRKGGGTVRKV
jgi:hypothetical protein